MPHFAHGAVGIAVNAEHLADLTLSVEAPLPHVLYGARHSLGVGVDEHLEPPMHDLAP